MTRFRSPTIALTLTAILSCALHAQARSAGGVNLDKTIYTKIYIGVGDALAPPLPIEGVRLLLVSASNDTLKLATDAAGAAAIYVPRGQYQLVSLDWVTSGGKNYKWHMPLTVAPGMRDVELTTGNSMTPPKLTVAESNAEIAPSSSGTIAVSVPAAKMATDMSGRRRVVDGSGFAWDVFEQPFGEGATWGQAMNAPGERVALVFNRDQETRQLDKFPPNWRALSNDDLAKYLDKATRVRP